MSEKKRRLFEVVSLDDYWPCACVKRRKGQLTHIKGNHPSIERCSKCGCTKAASDQIGTQS